MIKRKQKECELCGKITEVWFCKCDACQNIIYDNTYESPKRRGRWLCKDCLEVGSFRP